MDIQERIMQKLCGVIDPETGLNIVRMGLIQNLHIEENKNEVHLVFRPTSFLCPSAFKLAEDIRNALRQVVDASAIKIEVQEYARAKQLNVWLAESRESRKALAGNNENYR
jgi:metal-sulfur cluster biosynthetic enzyme